MKEYVYITANILTAEALTSITGTESFRGRDTQGDFFYSPKLNKLENLQITLEPAPANSSYDYVVLNTGGLRIRNNWIDNFQYETNWNLVPVDEIVEVSMDETNWYKMHFSHYDDAAPDGKYFFVFGAGRSSGTSLDWHEIITITMKNWETLSGKRILIYSSDNKYYVWFNLDNRSTDPSITDYTGIEINIETGEPADSIANKVKDALDSLSDFNANISSSDDKIIEVEVAEVEKTYNASAANSSLQVNVIREGDDLVAWEYARPILS